MVSITALWQDVTSYKHTDVIVTLLQEAAVKEDVPAPAERNPAAVKYTGNLVSSLHLYLLRVTDSAFIAELLAFGITSVACQDP